MRQNQSQVIELRTIFHTGSNRSLPKRDTFPSDHFECGHDLVRSVESMLNHFARIFLFEVKKLT